MGKRRGHVRVECVCLPIMLVVCFFTLKTNAKFLKDVLTSLQDGAILKEKGVGDMKKVALFLLSVAMCACFAGCGGKGSDNADGAGVHYAINYGTKVEDLSTSTQTKIDDYVSDCKALLINAYKGTKYSYDVCIADTFVYDFRGVNESSLDEDSLTLWNALTGLRNNQAKPLAYVEFDGCVLENDCPIYGLNATAVANGFFVFDDNSVLNYSYNRLVSYTAVKTLMNGTEIINCGDKYAEEFTLAEIKAFNKKPTKLHLV